MAKEKILIIDDDVEILEYTEEALKQEGYQVKSATAGESGLKLVASFRPELILLDLMLPGMDGLSVCKNLKARTESAAIPVIMLSAKDADADIVTGLELGAEDYITKPFRSPVLIARVRTVLRRMAVPEQQDDQPLELHDLVIHPGRHEVLYKKKLVKLTPTEFKILHVLAARPGWVFTRYQIVDAVRGEDFAVTDRSVDVQISALRRKLGKAGELVETIRGIGYRVKD
jgi:two-component system, OmpR family, alkaline phosphatase synthesis response regulator PhoP